MRIDVLGTEFDSITMAEALETAEALIRQRRAAYVVTPNPEIIMACRRDSQAAEAVKAADLVLPDGVGVTYGARILGTPLRQRLPGIDFTTGLLGRMAAKGQSVFLFGSKPGVAEKAAERLEEQFPGLCIAGTENGYFTDDGPVVERINSLAPDLLLVCLGAPKQEKWMLSHKGQIKAGLMIGAGGSLDVFAGDVERAPEKWQKAGLEWFYRLLKEPRRFKRMTQLPVFLLLVIGKRIKGNHEPG